MNSLAAVTTSVLLSIGAVAVPASADTGSLNDPKGDLPDIVRLSYDNASKQVVMTLKFADSELAQNVSFYMRWGSDKSYQVFYDKAGQTAQLRYNGKAVSCDKLVVTDMPDKELTRAKVPRGCLSKAPDKLKFQGIATAGLMSSDETKVSALVARG